MPEAATLRAFYITGNRDIPSQGRRGVCCCEARCLKTTLRRFSCSRAGLLCSQLAVATTMLAVVQPDAEADASPNAKVLGEVFPVTNYLREVRENMLKFDWLYGPPKSLEEHRMIDGEIENHRSP
jgi:hypothetical protein